ncbi:hypothetical protein TD95_002518 [Thielaviopsis punctulata]|uniref:Uncharacterized protein n=1 Tax=Thielaviopsis punctulata TaxID=72032 RepID=A0A0F4ZHC7_9PEZI|nr:hypothetical protein TD95_002518 [Thielaviopsis punctulata]
MTSPFVVAARRVTRELHGVVVSSGLMDKTVKVRVGSQKWNSRVSKWFSVPKNHLVHDPNNSLKTGDVVAITPGWRTSGHKRHVVKHIIAPASTPIEERPPVPTLEERIAEYETKKAAKDARRKARKDAEIQARIEAKKAKKAAKQEQTVETAPSDVD